jgi:hypothetical protein
MMWPSRFGSVAVPHTTDADELILDATGEGELAREVIAESAQPEVLAAELLRYQRLTHKLTLADVQKKLGAASINAYAAYEQGKRAPTLAKFRELLAAVAPDMVMTVGRRRAAER